MCYVAREVSPDIVPEEEEPSMVAGMELESTWYRDNTTMI
jgi:hypothetical protein